MKDMTRNFLENLLRSAFDFAALEDELVEAISDFIDYEELARSILSEHSAEIDDALREIAEDEMA